MTQIVLLKNLKFAGPVLSADMLTLKNSFLEIIFATVKRNETQNLIPGILLIHVVKYVARNYQVVRSDWSVSSPVISWSPYL